MRIKDNNDEEEEINEGKKVEEKISTPLGMAPKEEEEKEEINEEEEEESQHEGENPNSPQPISTNSYGINYEVQLQREGQNQSTQIVPTNNALITAYPTKSETEIQELQKKLTVQIDQNGNASIPNHEFNTNPDGFLPMYLVKLTLDPNKLNITISNLTPKHIDNIKLYIQTLPNNLNTVITFIEKLQKSPANPKNNSANQALIKALSILKSELQSKNQTPSLSITSQEKIAALTNPTLTNMSGSQENPESQMSNPLSQSQIPNPTLRPRRNFFSRNY